MNETTGALKSGYLLRR